MSELESFISRWRRLKRLARLKQRGEDGLPEDATSSSAAAMDAAAHQDTGTEKPVCTAAAFDPASLPSIETIIASTDIRAFLQTGVPAELARAALRRAWVSDPVIRDFIGIAENQWDFTDPAAIPGFGPLQSTGDVAGFVAQAIARLDMSLDQSAARLPGHCAETTPTIADASLCKAIDHKTGQAQTTLVAQREEEAAAPTPDNNQLETELRQTHSRQDTSPRHGRNGHGGALPRWD